MTRARLLTLLVQLLGFEVVMDLGWVVTVASPANPSAQVTIVGNDDPAAPGISVGCTRLRVAVSPVQACIPPWSQPTIRSKPERRS